MAGVVFGFCGGNGVGGGGGVTCVFAGFVAQLAAFARLEAAEGAAQERQQFGEVFGGEGAQPVVKDAPQRVVQEEDGAGLVEVAFEPVGSMFARVGSGEVLREQFCAAGGVKVLFVKQQPRGVAGEQRVGVGGGEDVLQEALPVGVERGVVEQAELVVGLADGGKEGAGAVMVDVEAALDATGGKPRQQGVEYGEERRGVKRAHVAVAHGVGEVGQGGEAVGEVVLGRGEVGDVAGEGGDKRGQVGG